MISIHAPRTGSDASPRANVCVRGRFQSTLPARGATRKRGSSAAASTFQSTLPARGATLRRCRFPFRFLISIHAPRTGSDGSTTTALATTFYFNPRSPHGERQLFKRSLASTLGFQSTLPARGATVYHFNRLKRIVISIHAPRTGSDVGRPIKPNAIIAISIHAPRTGSDRRL